MFAFSLAAVGIEIIFPLIKDNQDSITKTYEGNKTRHENRELAKKLNENRKADRKTASTTPKRVTVVEEPIFQMEQVEKGTPRPSFRTPRTISQEYLIAFSLAAVGIEIISPLIKDNQDSITKTSEEIHSQENIQHFCAPVIHPKTGELITSYKRLAKDPDLKEVWKTGFGK